MLVSFYPNPLQPGAGETQELPALLDGIRTGRWAQAVKQVRAAASSAARSEAKKALPAFTASGTFSTRREAGLLAHSGMLALDLDAKQNPGWDVGQVRAQLVGDSYTYALFTSAGGAGLCWLVLVPPSAATHADSFRALQAYARDTYDLAVDSLPDVSRLRFVSCDPELYHAPKADVFEALLAPVLKAPAWPAPTVPPSARPLDTEAALVAVGVQLVRNAADGAKHYAVRDAAFLLGGYVGSGFVGEATAYEALLAAIGNRENVADLKNAEQAIRSGLAKGAQKPLLPDWLQMRVRKELRESGGGSMAVQALAAREAAAAHLPAAGIEAAVQEIAQEQAQAPTLLTFWRVVHKEGRKRDQDTYTLQLSPDKYLEWLAESGFCKYRVGEGAYATVRVRANVVHRQDSGQLKDFMNAYLATLPFEFDNVYRPLLKDAVRAQDNRLFDARFLQNLPGLSVELVRDAPTLAYLFYRNAVVVATKDGPELLGYEQLPGLVWAEQLIARDFTLLSQEEIEAGEFFRFLWNLADRKPERLRLLLLLLGYYLHGYKDPSNPRVGVLLDEGMGPDGQANGGTGKSLLFKALGHLLNVVEVDGKGYDPRNAKALQQVTDATRVIFFNDWDAHRIPFDRLFNMATDTLTVERLYTGQQSYDFAVSPKIGLATNGVLTGQGGSHERRKYEVEIAPYYGPHRQPRDEFGHNFFTESWPAQEWARFDALMVHACCLYLGTGGKLAAPASQGLQQRRLVAATSAGFVAFMDSQPRGVKLYRPELLAAFVVAEGYDGKSMTPHRFGAWLAAYKQFNTDFESGQERDGPLRGQRWILLARSATE
ncbi:MAG: BT4734/BF3469 family protein [Janthinobacterium lividum]